MKCIKIHTSDSVAVAIEPLKKGDVVKPEDIAVLRTEKVLSTGIGPEFLDVIYGKQLSCDVQNGAGVRFEDFM